jgi:hypothetical protein
VPGYVLFDDDQGGLSAIRFDFRKRWKAYSYDVAPGGDHFLFMKRVERPSAQPLVVVLGWRPDMGKHAANPK